MLCNKSAIILIEIEDIIIRGEPATIQYVLRRYIEEVYDVWCLSIFG